MARWGQTFFRFCFPVLIPLQEAPTGYCSAAGGCLAVWISAVLPVSFFDGADIIFRGCGERRGACAPGPGGPGERPFRGGGRAVAHPGVANRLISVPDRAGREREAAEGGEDGGTGEGAVVRSGEDDGFPEAVEGRRAVEEPGCPARH